MHSNPASLNSYWRLNNYDDETVQQLKKRLKDADYPFSNGDRKPVLISKVHMVDCGAICYDRYTTAEIRQFGKDRGLPKTHTAKPARHTTVKKLVESDMSPEFHRFLDLPPEPRTRIYGHYMGDFPKEFTTPAQPPLARTCNLVRDEVLAIFYGAHTIVLSFDLIPLLRGPRSTHDTTRFLQTLSIESVAELRRLQLYVQDTGSIVLRSEPRTICECSFDINSRINTYEVSISGNLGITPGVTFAGDSYKDRRERLELRLWRVLDSLVVSEGKKRLAVDDIYALRTAMASVLGQD